MGEAQTRHLSGYRYLPSNTTVVSRDFPAAWQATYGQNYASWVDTDGQYIWIYNDGSTEYWAYASSPTSNATEVTWTSWPGTGNMTQPGTLMPIPHLDKLIVVGEDSDNDPRIGLWTWDPVNHTITKEDDAQLSSGASINAFSNIVYWEDTANTDLYIQVTRESNGTETVMWVKYDLTTEAFTDTLNSLNVTSGMSAVYGGITQAFEYTLGDDPFHLPGDIYSSSTVVWHAGWHNTNRTVEFFSTKGNDAGAVVLDNSSVSQSFSGQYGANYAEVRMGYNPENGKWYLFIGGDHQGKVEWRNTIHEATAPNSTWTQVWDSDDETWTTSQANEGRYLKNAVFVGSKCYMTLMTTGGGDEQVKVVAYDCTNDTIEEIAESTFNATGDETMYGINNQIGWWGHPYRGDDGLPHIQWVSDMVYDSASSNDYVGYYHIAATAWPGSATGFEGFGFVPM